jgi:hypothetical protein
VLPKLGNDIREDGDRVRDRHVDVFAGEALAGRRKKADPTRSNAKGGFESTSVRNECRIMCGFRIQL